MADDTVQAGPAPANAPHDSLAQREGESSQQHGDRLLAASRRGVNMAGDNGVFATGVAHKTLAPFMKRDELDKLEDANAEQGYVKALNQAITDAVDKIRGLVAPGGAREDGNLFAWARHADMLLCLQSTHCDLVEAGVYAGIMGWPRQGDSE